MLYFVICNLFLFELFTLLQFAGLPFLWIETIDVLFHDLGKSPFQIGLIKDLRHLKPDEILLLF